MQTLVPIGTFEGKARRLLGKAGFDDMLDGLFYEQSFYTPTHTS